MIADVGLFNFIEVQLFYCIKEKQTHTNTFLSFSQIRVVYHTLWYI